MHVNTCVEEIFKGKHYCLALQKCETYQPNTAEWSSCKYSTILTFVIFNYNVIKHIQTVVILRTFLELSSDRHTWAWLSVCSDRLLEDTTSGTWDTPSHSDFSDNTVIFCSTVDGRQSQEKARNWDFLSGKLSQSPSNVSGGDWKTIICLKGIKATVLHL